MTSFKVTVTSKEIIKPSSPTPPHLKTVQLSFIDQFQHFIYNSFTFFYEPHSVHTEQRTLLLKKSLSDILVTFYPLAGRVKDNLSIECNDEGVEFYEANVVSDVTVLEVVEALNIDDLRGLLPFETTIHDKNVLVGVQVNYFACGGMALGVCVTHKVADVASSMHFVKAWATMARLQGEGELLPNQKFDGALYFPPIVSSEDRKAVLGEEKLVTRRCVFSKKVIEELKEESNMKDPTRVEVVSAFIWKRYMNLIQPVPELNDSRIFHVVNLRPRMEPPLSEESFGNYSWVTPTDSVNIHEGGSRHPELVPMIREAIRRFDPEYIKTLQQCGPDKFLQNQVKEVKFESEKILFFSSMCRYPFYEVDFGWGEPIRGCMVTSHFKNTVTLLSTRCGDGIEAWFLMAEDDIAKLERDPELVKLLAP